MVTWVLILTLWGRNYDAGVAIEHIDGFATREQCLAAGNAWLRRRHESIDPEEISALCVQRQR